MAENKTVCVSGGFDPIQTGHIDLINSAAIYGNVIVILNSDDWLIRKKGYCFMPFFQRAKILLALKNVAQVTSVDDRDNTICEALKRVNPDYFANGGDRVIADISESIACKELGIEQLFGIGGKKTASSSELVKAAVQYVK